MPQGFILLDAKDSTRGEIEEEKNKVAVQEKKSLLGYLGFKQKVEVAKLHHMDDEFK
jgi:hypothetical protein